MGTRVQDRRRFLSDAVRAAGGLMLSPAILRQDTVRPSVLYGAAGGDVAGNRSAVWSRTIRPARRLVEWSTTESFQNPQRVRGPSTSENVGYTARVDVTNLPPGQQIFYRVQFEDL